MSSEIRSRSGDTMMLSNAVESSRSAVSWPAILAGAFVASAISLALFAFGSGIGLAAMSPWSASASPVVKFTIQAAIWLIIMQWVASAFGGYITGRLRTKWTDLHTDEVFFRDTAHGFLTWAVATVVTAALFASVSFSVMQGTAKTAATAAVVSSENVSSHPMDYFTDSLFRSTQRKEDSSIAAIKQESVVILMRSSRDGGLSEADKSYLAQQIAANTGISVEEANQRIDEVITQIKVEADEARKTAAIVAIALFLSMVIGAFIASVAAALGGKQRDQF